MQHSTLIPVLLACLALPAFAAGKGAPEGATPFSDHYLSLTFRESPYAPHRGIHRITPDRAATINHFRFDHDAEGRIRRITFALGDHPRRPNHTANYFWYAASEHYRYDGRHQRVTWFDEWGEPTTVHGDVAAGEYLLDEHGRRIELTYLGRDGRAVESAWGIHRYQWRHLDDGSVIESRFGLDGKAAPLRPGFDFGHVRLAYDVDGLTRLMQHVDAAGTVLGSEGDFAQDRFTHSRHGELLRYDVLDPEGQATSNHQGIASGLLTFTPEGYEKVSSYRDRNGEPVPTGHGWWRSERAYDRFGNLVLNAFQDRHGKPHDNPSTGYASAVITWRRDGLERESMRYFDAGGQPVDHASRGYHAVLYRDDPGGTPIGLELVDSGGALVERPDQGWAVTRLEPGPDGSRPVETRYPLAELGRSQADEALTALHRVSRVPGLAAAIAIDGEVVWHGEAGLADIEAGIPVAPATVFRLASVSKAVTSVVAARALENQWLDLDTRASALLPLDHHATLAQLLSHTGSVDHYRATIAVDLDRPYASSLDALPTVVPHLLGDRPGSRYLYSTFGFTLAAAMVEAAGGIGYPQLLAQLAAEAGAPSLSALEDAASSEHLTRFYDIAPDGPAPARPRNFSYGFAGAGVVSNAGDLAKFMSLFAAGRLVDPAWRDRMLAAAAFADGSPVRDRSYEVALGWRRQADAQGHAWYHHAGVTDGARSIAVIDPSRRLAIVILSNAAWTSDMFGTATTLARLLLPPHRAGDATRPAALVFAGERSQLSFQRCAGLSCSWRGTGEGSLAEWLARGGRGSGLAVHVSPGGRYLSSPYGLSWIDAGTARIGARTVTLEYE